MLKKAGIVAAGATAALLAVSPLAFAGEKGEVKGDHWGKDGHPHGHTSIIQNNGTDDSNEANGLVAVNALNNNEVNVPINACDNNLNAVGIQLSDLTGALGIGGEAVAANGTECSIANGSGGLQGNSIGGR